MKRLEEGKEFDTEEQTGRGHREKERKYLTSESDNENVKEPAVNIPQHFNLLWECTILLSVLTSLICTFPVSCKLCLMLNVSSLCTTHMKKYAVSQG